MWRAPSSCGTRAGTSTRSPRTSGSALYARLGLYPNLGVAWVTAFVCGPERPTVAVIDFAAPLPAGEELTRPDAGAQPGAGVRGAARALPRPPQRARRGARRPCLAPARRAPARRSRWRSTSCGRRSAIPMPTAWRRATRFPAPSAAPSRRRGHARARRASASATTPGARATGGRRSGCGLPGTSRRHPRARRRVPPTQRAADRRRLRAAAGGRGARARLGAGVRGGGGERADRPRAHRVRRARRRGRAARLRPAAARGSRRADDVLPASDVPVARSDGRTGTGWVEWNRNASAQAGGGGVDR